jgi:hypothetical protein
MELKKLKDGEVAVTVEATTVPPFMITNLSGLIPLNLSDTINVTVCLSDSGSTEVIIASGAVVSTITVCK